MTTTKKSDPKYVDALEEDRPINGQKYVCMSFVSPEDIIKQKDMFFFENFVKHWDFAKSMEKYVQFLNFVSFKHKLDFDALVEDLKEFTQDEKNSLVSQGIEDDYKTFIEKYEDSLTQEYTKRHQVQTSVRGIKIRGSYDTIQEAELRCKMIRDIDPNFDVYVGQVGMWIPFHPDAYKTGRVEYLEEQLNELMHEKMKNEQTAKQEFDKRVKDTKKKAIEDNIKLASQTNNTLTQTIDNDGNLVGVKNMNTQESILSSKEAVSLDDVRNELFSGENIIPEKDGLRMHQETKDIHPDFQKDYEQFVKQIKEQKSTEKNTDDLPQSSSST